MRRRSSARRSPPAPPRSGRSTPAISARMRRAPAKSVFSISATKAKTSPPRWQPKQYQDCFCSLTEKLAVRSWWNGHSPTYSRPCLRSRTCCCTTSTRFTRSRIRSRTSSSGGGRMVVRKYYEGPGPRAAPTHAGRSGRAGIGSGGGPPRLGGGPVRAQELRAGPRLQHPRVGVADQVAHPPRHLQVAIEPHTGLHSHLVQHVEGVLGGHVPA